MRHFPHASHPTHSSGSSAATGLGAAALPDFFLPPCFRRFVPMVVLMISKLRHVELTD